LLKKGLQQQIKRTDQWSSLLNIYLQPSI